MGTETDPLLKDLYFVTVDGEAAATWGAIVSRIRRHNDLADSPMTLDQMEDLIIGTIAEVRRLLDGGADE